MTTIQELNRWLEQPENYHLEFKEARNKFNYERKLVDYCAALANEGGGKLLLGVNDNGEVVGSNVFFGTHTKEANKLLDQIGLRVDIEELNHPQGRVLVFHVPPHYLGKPVRSNGIYWMRAGESLTPMDEQTLLRKLSATEPDYTAEIVSGLSIDDLDKAAIEKLKSMWSKESAREEYNDYVSEKALMNLGLLTESGITYAGLILLGKPEKIREKLPDAEIIFEWRNNPDQIHHDFRKSWRDPFINIDEDIWNTINARNIVIPFQEGFVRREVLGFDKKSVREAVHNAVMHRSYTASGRSVFIKASPVEFYIESPGGLVPPVTLENILRERAWRNRLLAETFEKVGFAERSSQGIDDIFNKSIRDGKGIPDLSRTDSNTVRLSIPAQVKDEDFILYLERVANEKQISFSFEEIYELERIRENQRIENPQFKKKFIQEGLIEPIGKGRGTKYILSRKYYEAFGQSGRHTRIKGLERSKVKELILNHIKEGKPSRRIDLASGFPEYSPQDISNILQELKKVGKIFHQGSAIGGVWHTK